MIEAVPGRALPGAGRSETRRANAKIAGEDTRERERYIRGTYPQLGEVPFAVVPFSSFMMLLPCTMTLPAWPDTAQ